MQRTFKVLGTVVLGAVVSTAGLRGEDVTAADLRSPERGSFDLSQLAELSAATIGQEEEGGPLSGWSLSGSLDVAYTMNFDSPRNRDTGTGGAVPAAPRTNKNRIFDTEDQDFMLHALRLDISKKGMGDLPIDLNVVFTAGEDAAGIHSAGLADGDIDITDLNFVVTVPGDIPVLSGGELVVGKFETTIGYEVIPSISNDNYSRSMLFGFAIPFTHTGVLFRQHHDIGENGATIGWNVGVVNGWDAVDDLDQNGQLDGDKSVMGGVGISPNDMFEINANGIVDGDKGVLDIVSKVKLPDQGVVIGTNVDYGASDVDASGGAKYQKWYGLAGYFSYDMAKLNVPCLEKCKLHLRAEVFWDRDGDRVPTSFGGAGASRYYDLTATFAYQAAEDLLLRLEYRYDKADTNVFDDGNDFADQSHQSTIALNSVLTF